MRLRASLSFKVDKEPRATVRWRSKRQTLFYATLTSNAGILRSAPSDKGRRRLLIAKPAVVITSTAVSRGRNRDREQQRAGRWLHRRGFRGSGWPDRAPACRAGLRPLTGLLRLLVRNSYHLLNKSRYHRTYCKQVRLRWASARGIIASVLEDVQADAFFAFSQTLAAPGKEVFPKPW